MIRVGIVGYGNLGRAVEKNIARFPDIELVAVFSRRPDSVKASVRVEAYSSIPEFKNQIDVMLMCGGSATDLPVQSPEVLQYFCTVDSFDNHAQIKEFYKKMNEIGKESNTLSAISVGWDPGLFSLTRVLFSSILPDGKEYTFWGKGVSQGHSDAIRRIDGVKMGIQYTIPKDSALKAARDEAKDLTAREKHLRECFVVAKENADKKAIEKAIVTMPNYFEPYDTVVHFISEKEFKEKHSALPHGGFVLRSGKTDEVTRHLIELSIKLDSNPEFTSSIILAYARAVYRMYAEGRRGAITVLDVPVAYLSAESYEELLSKSV